MIPFLNGGTGMKYVVYMVMLASGAQIFTMESNERRLDLLVGNAVQIVQKKYRPLNDDERDMSVVKKELQDQLSTQLKDNGLNVELLPLMHQAFKKLYAHKEIEITIDNSYEIKAIDVTPDGNYIVCGDISGGVYLWKGREGWEEDCEAHQGAPITAVCFAPNKCAVSADKDGYVYLRKYSDWDFESEMYFQLPGTMYADMIAVSDDGTQCACAHNETKTVLMYQYQDGDWIQSSRIASLYDAMVPSMIGWRDKTLIAFCQELGKERTKDYIFSEWQSLNSEWFRVNSSSFEDEEAESAAAMKYNLTRRTSLGARDLRGTVGVIGNGTQLIILDNEPGYNDIIMHLIALWRKEREL